MDTIMKINFGTCPTTTSLLREIMQTTATACLSTLFVDSFTYFKHSPSSVFQISNISMIISNLAIKFKCWTIAHDTNWPLYYTMVSILKCLKTLKQVFVAEYLFLEQKKQIWEEPLCSGHLSIADTFLRSQWCLL